MPQERAFHESITRWIEDLPRNPHKQLLFTEARTHRDWCALMDEPEKIGARGKKATGFTLRNVATGIWNREKALAYLEYLDVALDHARSVPPMVAPGGSATARQSRGKEALQTQWLKNAKLRETVEELQRKLEEAASAFDHKIVAARLAEACRQVNIRPVTPRHLLGHEAWEGMTLKQAQDELTRLENAYYRQGNNHLEGAGKIASQLDGIEGGRFFLLDAKELTQAANNRMGGRHRRAPA
ncbi:MAG: hypothetical protein AABW54_01820 [Candidatus Micrarchaeota archaeon]